MDRWISPSVFGTPIESITRGQCNLYPSQLRDQVGADFQ